MWTAYGLIFLYSFYYYILSHAKMVRQRKASYANAFSLSHMLKFKSLSKFKSSSLATFSLLGHNAIHPKFKGEEIYFGSYFQFIVG